MIIIKNRVFQIHHSGRHFSRKTRSIADKLNLKSKIPKKEQQVKEEDVDFVKMGDEFTLDKNLYYQLLNKIMDHRKAEAQSKLDPESNEENKTEKVTPEEFKNTLEEAEVEMSDLEYEASSKSVFHFVPPPKSHSENLDVLSQADARYEHSKHWLDGKRSKEYYEYNLEKKKLDATLNSNIPDNFFITNLEYPKTGSNIIALGVERQSYMHAYMVSDLLTKINPNGIFTQLPPDLPFLIRKPKKLPNWRKEKYEAMVNETDNAGYQLYWKEFMRDKLTPDFYINPGPHYLVDTMVLKSKTEKIIDENLKPGHDLFDIGANIAYTKPIDKLSPDLKPDGFMTTLVHQYNNLDTNLQLIFGGFPQLALQDMIVKQHSFKELDAYFDIMIQKFKEGEYNFDPQYLMIDHCIRPQANYMAELLRQSGHSAKTIVAVVDKEMIPHLEDAWKTLPKQQAIIDFYKRIPTNSPDTPYVEFIQSHTLIDLMLGSFVNENFMKYTYFPFSGAGLLGWKSSTMNVIKFWDYYYNQHTEKLGQVTVHPLDEYKYEERIKNQDGEKTHFEKMFDEFDHSDFRNKL